MEIIVFYRYCFYCFEDGIILKKINFISLTEYNEYFGDKGMREKALNVALETRKFEIELYWKRATYFWLFVAAIFTAYASIKRSQDTFIGKSDILVLLACCGIVFSFAWICVNRASKPKRIFRFES